MSKIVQPGSGPSGLFMPTEMHAENIRMREALRLALPVMRRTAAEYLDSVMVRSDPSTIARAEWDEIRPDLEAIAAAEACIGRSKEPSWLDGIIDAGKWREVPHD